MKTILLKAGTVGAVEKAADIIRRGGTVAIPTETVYGLGANGLDAAAVRRIFEAKGRPNDNPLILHVADETWITRYCQEVPPQAYSLAERFWPGPLTMILKKKDLVPAETTAGLDTVGIRCPRHAFTNALIRTAGVPIAAPSANISGRPSTTGFMHVFRDMNGKIDAIVDGGDCAVGLESTIVDLTANPPRLLRPGGITLEQLRAVLGNVEVDDAVRRLMSADERPKAPGMKYRHYAPKAPVTVICGEPTRTAEYIRQTLAHSGHGTKTGVLCFDEFLPLFEGFTAIAYGGADDPTVQAEKLFDALRAFDDTEAAEIFAQCPGEEGLGLAVSNRLKKSAGFHVIELK